VYTPGPTDNNNTSTKEERGKRSGRKTSDAHCRALCRATYEYIYTLMVFAERIPEETNPVNPCTPLPLPLPLTLNNCVRLTLMWRFYEEFPSSVKESSTFFLDERVPFFSSRLSHTHTLSLSLSLFLCFSSLPLRSTCYVFYVIIIVVVVVVMCTVQRVRNSHTVGGLAPTPAYDDEGRKRLMVNRRYISVHRIRGLQPFFTAGQISDKLWHRGPNFFFRGIER